MASRCPAWPPLPHLRRRGAYAATCSLRADDSCRRRKVRSMAWPSSMRHLTRGRGLAAQEQLESLTGIGRASLRWVQFTSVFLRDLSLVVCDLVWYAPAYRPQRGRGACASQWIESCTAIHPRASLDTAPSSGPCTGIYPRASLKQYFHPNVLI